MKYQVYDLNSYKLHIIKTSKFKTVSVLINFKRPINKKETTLRSFLPLVLLNSTKKFPTKRLLNINAEELYGLDIGFNQRRLGNYGIMTFGLNMINEKWTEKGIYEKNLKFLFEILFDPNVKNESFDSKAFNLEKNSYISKLKSIKDDTRQYGVTRMLEEMDKKSPISYRLGYLDDLKKITEKELYDYYLNVLNSDEIDVFVLGDVDISETKRIFKTGFLINTIKKDRKDLFIKHNTYRKRIKKVVEKENVKQSKLSIGCKLIDLTEYERKYVMPVYANILGGPSYSKLFRTIREKHSLAYYVSCSYSAADNLLTIYSGINKDNFDKSFLLVKRELLNMVKGTISDEELDNSKKDTISVLEAIEDIPDRVINDYLLMELLQLEDIKTRKKSFNSVTKDDIKKVAKKIKIDTVHLLYGDDKDEEDTD